MHYKSGRMSNIEVLTWHGWGLDTEFWSNLQRIVSPYCTNWMNIDRGYFGAPQTPEFMEQKATKIIITHSWGLHQCSDEMTSKADYLIIFSGFLDFHPVSVRLRRRSKQILNKMISRFQEEPHKVLKAFHQNIFRPQEPLQFPRKTINQSLLLKDLKRLNNSKRPLPTVKRSANILIFHGTDDAIVPKRKGQCLYKEFGNRAQYVEVKNGGHALPGTHAKRCWQIIQSEILQPIR
jgi:pimeloyl-[acyl-carrier protein] methyl ester esterase